ncbi:MAG TPA: DUF6677 family protein [Tepidisphaeraceae bacterium]|jgi:hypothetical protein|nr:DUF6677 family protein [Tepidisphaeraceae bacterium]
MPAARSSLAASPSLVGLCAWLVPGGGYFLLGQRSRALVVGITVIALFLAGILVGGIRIMDPPGWGTYGYMDQLVQRADRGRVAYDTEPTRVEPSSAAQAQDPRNDDHDKIVGSALINEPIAELSDKPWFVGQILCGPLTLVASAVSVHLAKPTTDSPIPQEGVPSSHSRSWEIGALYTAVAGMLNLLVIIDSAYCATRAKSQE